MANFHGLDEMDCLNREEQAIEMAKLKDEVEQVNRHSICGKNELKWEVKKLFADFPSLTYIGLDLLMKEFVKGIQCRMGKIDRNISLQSHNNQK